MSSAQVFVHHAHWPYARMAQLKSAHHIARSFQLMAAGNASLSIAQTDAQATNPDVLKFGNLLVITSLLAPPWVGPITLIDEVSQDGIIRLEALEWTSALQVSPIRTGEVWTQAASGAVFAGIIQEVNIGGHRGLFCDVNAAPGPTVTNDAIGGQQADQALADLHTKTDYEWWVDYQVKPSSLLATMHWTFRQGLDRSASSYWIESRDFVKRERQLDVSKMRQSVTVVGGVGSIQGRTAATVAAGTAPAAAVLGTAMQGANQNLIDFINVPPVLRAAVVQLQRATSDRQTMTQIAEQTLERLVADAAKYVISKNIATSWDVGLGDFVTVVTSPRGLGSVKQRARIMGFQPDEEVGETDIVLNLPLR